MLERLIAFTLMLLISVGTLVTAGSATPASPRYRLVSIADEPGTAHAVRAGYIAGQLGDDAFVWSAGNITCYRAVAITSLDGPYRAIATSVNAAGVAVGHDGNYQPIVMSGLELAQAAIFRAGRVEFSLGDTNGTFEADGINDRGEIVGENGFRGFLRRTDGTMIEIKPLSTRDEGNGTRASAIDAEGRIVGGTTVDVANVADLPVHGFFATIRDGGVQRMRDLGALPGYSDTYATALNEEQIVVGYSGTHAGSKWSRVWGPSHAWVWQAGRIHDLGTLRSDKESWAYGVNDAATIVGCSGGTAVRWVDKRIQDLNRLATLPHGWHLVCAHAIDNAGWIVGNAVTDGGTRPVVLIPTR